MTDIRDRVKEFMGKHNEEFPAKKVTRSIPLPPQIFPTVGGTYCPSIATMFHKLPCTVLFIIDQRPVLSLDMVEKECRSSTNL